MEASPKKFLTFQMSKNFTKDWLRCLKSNEMRYYLKSTYMYFNCQVSLYWKKRFIHKQNTSKYTKIHECSLIRVSFDATLIFPLMHALVYEDINSVFIREKLLIIGLCIPKIWQNLNIFIQFIGMLSREQNFYKCI